jgi:hypothetical protein
MPHESNAQSFIAQLAVKAAHTKQAEEPPQQDAGSAAGTLARYLTMGGAGVGGLLGAFNAPEGRGWEGALRGAGVGASTGAGASLGGLGGAYGGAAAGVAAGGIGAHTVGEDPKGGAVGGGVTGALGGAGLGSYLGGRLGHAAGKGLMWFDKEDYEDKDQNKDLARQAMAVSQ